MDQIMKSWSRMSQSTDCILFMKANQSVASVKTEPPTNVSTLRDVNMYYYYTMIQLFIRLSITILFLSHCRVDVHLITPIVTVLIRCEDET